MVRCKAGRRGPGWGVALWAAIVAAGCMDEVADVAAPDARSGIAGQVELPAAVRGLESVTVVAAYADRAAFVGGRPAATTTVVTHAMRGRIVVERVDASATRFALELPAGSYFVDAWCDVDDDRQFSAGDAYGFHAAGGSSPVAIEVVDGAETPVVLELELLAPAATQRALGRLSLAKSQWIRWSRTASTYSLRRFW
jgi:hypothetical protein